MNSPFFLLANLPFAKRLASAGVPFFEEAKLKEGNPQEAPSPTKSLGSKILAHTPSRMDDIREEMAKKKFWMAIWKGRFRWFYFLVFFLLGFWMVILLYTVIPLWHSYGMYGNHGFP